MSESLLTWLSVIEIVVLITILAIYLIAVARGLKRIANTLQEVTWGARAVERQLRAVESNVLQINAALTDIKTVAPGVVRMAEQLARGGVRS
ncbi:MAG: hypothetical protein ABIP53_00460 [Candidatus Limnocylindrales bacterium]